MSNIGAEIVLGTTEVVSRRETDSLEAWLQLRQGLENVIKFTREANVVAREHLEKAIVIDPEFAAAHAWLGTAHRDLAMFGWSDEFDTELEQAFKFYG